MRLKDDMDLAVSTLPRRGESGANFCRMMPVIVNHGHASCVAANLKTPIHTAKVFEGLLNVRHGNVEPDADRNRCRRIQHVVHSGNVKAKFAEIAATILDGKTTNLWGHGCPRPCRAP